MIRKPLEEHANDAVKFVIWAIGIGAGSTIAILSYAFATFETKEVYAANQRVTELEIINIKSAVVEIKESNSEFQKWLRENWHKKNP